MTHPTDNDLIRRGDAIAALNSVALTYGATWEPHSVRLCKDALRALPAVQVEVKPLEWVELEKYRCGGKYSADGYTIRYVEGFFILDFAGEGKWKWRWTDLESAKAAAQAGYEARIRSAMTPKPSPDVAALVDALEWYADQFCEGFCQDFPSAGYTDKNCERDCGGCKARATLARVKGGE